MPMAPEVVSPTMSSWCDMLSVPISNHSGNDVHSVSPIESSVSRYLGFFLQCTHKLNHPLDTS